MDLALPLSVTGDLFIIGGFASAFTEFLRGLILKIEDYPRLARSWKYLPSFFGMVGILIFPEAIEPSSTLTHLAHGAFSPTIFYIAYPYIEKWVTWRVKHSFEGSTEKGLPSKEGNP
jgi:hypothetical protein